MLPTRHLAALALLLASPLAAATPVPTQDAKGFKDPPGLPRFTGSALFLSEAVDFDEVSLPAAAVRYTDDTLDTLAAAKSVTASGQRWRLMYRLPQGRSPLEVVRNYQQQLKTQGYTALWECAAEACGERVDSYNIGGSSFVSALYPFSETKKLGDAEAAACAGGAFMTDTRYAVLQHPTSGAVVAVFTHRPGIVSGSCPEDTWKQELFATVVHVKPKAMESHMQTLEASVLAKSLSDTGRVAIYGILFDTGLATIKPASQASLEQIAALLKKDTALNLHIVGHTDAQGGLKANFDLSQRRAQAVKAALVAQYGIAATRLTANGVASLAPVAPNTTEEGRAKNRRVELVPG